MRVIARNIVTQRQAALPSDIPLRSAAFWQHEYECYRLSRPTSEGQPSPFRDYLVDHYLNSVAGSPSPRFRICDRTPRGRRQSEISCYSAPLHDYLSPGHEVPSLTAILADSTDVNHAFETRRRFIQGGLSESQCAIFSTADLDASTNPDLERIPRSADEIRVEDYIHVNQTMGAGAGAL